MTFPSGNSRARTARMAHPRRPPMHAAALCERLGVKFPGPTRRSLPERGVAAISALPLKADIHRKGRHVPKVPIGVIASDDRKRKRPPTEVAYFGFSAFMCRT